MNFITILYIILAMFSLYLYHKIGEVSHIIFCAMFLILGRLEILAKQIKEKK